MLIKLLKYDLKWIYKVVAVFYCLSLFFSVTSFCFSKVENSALFSGLYTFSNAFAIAMVVNGVINSIIRAWVRFRNNIYKDESYLTHTLPVSLNLIYLSKVLSAVICIFTSTAVAAGCLVICFWNNNSIVDYLKTMLESAAGSFNLSAGSLFAALFFEIFLQLVFILLLGYNGMILGHRSGRNKMVTSIIVGFAMYMVSNTVTVLLIFAAGLFDDGIMNLIETSDTVDISAVKTVLLFALILYAVYNAVFYIMGSRLLKKGVDVE